MPKLVRSATSIIVLLSLLALFAGPAAAAIAPPDAKAQKSCCEGCGDKEKAPDPVPCSTADCPLLLCLAADLVEPLAPQVIVRETIFTFTFLPKPIPDPFVPSIFQPPKTA